MMENRRGDFSFKKTPNSKPRRCLFDDLACCSIGLECFPMRKSLKAQIKKGCTFKKSSTPKAQDAHRNSGADSSLLPNPTYLSSGPCARSEYQKKQALAVAVATAAAAEAAIVAAEAATQMAAMTAPSASLLGRGRRSQHVETSAATKIQSAFRGYLVRKALKVKSKAGLLRLQALAHGWVGQTQSVATLRSMQAFVRAQHVGVRRWPSKHQLWPKETPASTSALLRHSSKDRCHKSLINPSIKEDFDLTSRHCEEWDKSTKTMEENEARQETKRKAAVKRERAMAYNVFLHKKLTNKEVPHRSKDPGLHWNWLERWMATRIQGCQNSPKLPPPPPTPKHADNWPPPLESWSLPAGSHVNSQTSSLMSPNVRDDVLSVASFSGTPSYMADTESTRAKIRAHSAPKQRPVVMWCPSNSFLQKKPTQPCLHACNSSFCPRHISHMAHSQLHRASTFTKF